MNTFGSNDYLWIVVFEKVVEEGVERLVLGDGVIEAGSTTEDRNHRLKNIVIKLLICKRKQQLKNTLSFVQSLI